MCVCVHVRTHVRTHTRTLTHAGFRCYIRYTVTALNYKAFFVTRMKQNGVVTEWTG